MITLTRLNNDELIVNADLIEMIERTPDTVITMTTGRKVMVREKAEVVIAKVLEYRHTAGPILAKAIAPTHSEHFGEQARVDHENHEIDRDLSHNGHYAA
jgi:flagellar protein FlbD